VRPGEEVISVNVNWTVEKFVSEKTSSTKGKEESGKTRVKVKPAAKAKSKPKAKAPAKKKAGAKKPAAKAKPKKKK
jgi:hypothetical protein